jgi:hypothetical protein
MEGKGIIGLSLPVKIFEKRSMLEKICDLFSTGPIFLTRAGQTDDKIERIKNVIAFAISGL